MQAIWKIAVTDSQFEPLSRPPDYLSSVYPGEYNLLILRLQLESSSVSVGRDLKAK